MYRKKGRRAEGCVLEHPRKDSVYLCGRWINMIAVARTQAMSQAYVSYLINGEKEGTITYYIRIAAAIGVTLDELIAGIEERKALKMEQVDVLHTSYTSRVNKENEEDKVRKACKKPPIVRLPGFRLPTD